jgi:GNAT superfamily N-acetyltransferase
MPALSCRPMTRAELDMAVDWAAAEGWNPGLSDAEAFFAADPGGFWLGLLAGEPVACISVVRHSAEFGFLGFYIVRPGHRGAGHGWALWQAAIAHLGDRVIGLDGVPAQQGNYRRSGFALKQRNIRFAAASPLAPAAPRGIGIIPATFDAVAGYDRACVEAPREAFLRRWLTLPGHVALAAARDGRLCGYGVIRPAREGCKIGPLFADGVAEAEALLAALLAAVPHGPVFLDVPEPNRAAMTMAEAAGMAPVFETARMYRGAPPAVADARIFGITSFELG